MHAVVHTTTILSFAGVPRYEERSAGAHDSAPLREIKRAVAKIKVETRQMSQRIEWLRAHAPELNTGT